MSKAKEVAERLDRVTIRTVSVLELSERPAELRSIGFGSRGDLAEDLRAAGSHELLDLGGGGEQSS